jgi:hypothetical protein
MPAVSVGRRRPTGRRVPVLLMGSDEGPPVGLRTDTMILALVDKPPPRRARVVPQPHHLQFPAGSPL